MSANKCSEMIAKIKSRKAVIGVVGLGYVGLPLVLEFHKAGFPVLGFDLDQSKCKSLLSGKTYIRHIPDPRIKPLTRERFDATTDFSRVPEADTLLLCVPTPLTVNREPDMTYIENTGRSIGPYLPRLQPGTRGSQ